MKTISLWLSSALLAFQFLLITGCASEDKRADSPEGLFAIAQEFENDERFEEAIKRYTEVKNRFPYSAKAVDAELAIADVYFKQESFAEAQINYSTFRELHPKHPRIDYVIFRIGLSHFSQLPETIDRDLTLANDAITAFSEVLSKFPQSTHVTEATEKRNECYKKLSEKEKYIGDFYFKRDKFDSALVRYENVIKKYPQSPGYALALSQAAICAKKVGDDTKVNKYISLLESQFPNSDELSDARKATR